MKVLRTRILFDGAAVQGEGWFQQVKQEIFEAIAEVVWPEGEDTFNVYPKKQANGVKPIKDAFVLKLEEGFGWRAEERLSVYGERRPGPIDAVRWIDSERKYFAVEWETGNISSSHRALNKLTMGVLHGTLLGGILVLPSRRLYTYLTDRIGNYQELEPYFPVWEAVNTNQRGIVGVVEIEHDAESLDVPRIAKGTDGRALV